MSENQAQPSRPLTRRELRAREESAQPQAGAPAIPPASGGTPPPTRRSLHQPPAGASGSTPAPVVRPPATTGAMRGIDATTGRLTPVQRTGAVPVQSHVPVQPRPAQPSPAQPAPGAPTRTSARSAFPPRGAAGPAMPSSTPPASAPSASAASAAAPSAPSAGAPARPATAFAPVRRTGAAGGAAPAWGPVSGASAPQAAPASPDPAPTVAGMPASVPPGGRAASPFDAVLGAETPQRSRAAAPQPPQQEDPADTHGTSYTWLHYIIVVVVAFVLGLLLWKLIDTEQPSFSSADSAAATVTTVEPGPWEGIL
jgi:hypothetical protein